MTREQFVSQLRRALGGLPEAEKKEVLYDYEEHFRLGAAEGRSEEQIAQSLGNPRTLGRAHRIETLLDRPEKGGRVPASAVLGAVFASLGLTFFNVIFVLGPFFGLVGALVGLWAAAGSLAIAGAAGVLSPLSRLIVPRYASYGGLNPAFVLFAGIGVGALGLLALIGMAALTRLFFRGVAEYVKFNMRVVTRRR